MSLVFWIRLSKKAISMMFNWEKKVKSIFGFPSDGNFIRVRRPGPKQTSGSRFVKTRQLVIFRLVITVNLHPWLNGKLYIHFSLIKITILIDVTSLHWTVLTRHLAMVLQTISVDIFLHALHCYWFYQISPWRHYEWVAFLI